MSIQPLRGGASERLGLLEGQGARRGFVRLIRRAFVSNTPPEHVLLGATPRERPASEVKCLLNPVNLEDPLESDEHIRLLLLQPSRVSHTTTNSKPSLEERKHVRCAVFQAPLHTLADLYKPAYAALSYRWGNTERTKTIQCGSSDVKVHECLYEALLASRYEEEERFIWADALCIHQDDGREKNLQVQRMSQIYRNSHVIIWLGCSMDPTKDERTVLWLTVLSSVYGKQEQTLDLDDPLFARELKKALLRKTKSLGVNSLKAIPWTELHLLLFCNAYFTRLWIIQEVCWASSHEVRLDKWQFPPGFLRDLAMLCYELGHIMQSTLIANTNTGGLKGLMIGRDRTLYILDGTAADSDNHVPFVYGLSYAGIVSGHCDHDCSDPRDYIFGLASFFECSPPQKPYPIDYSLTTTEVFTDFVLNSIETDGNLDVLNQCCRQSFFRDPKSVAEKSDRVWTPGLPSWCPDWAGPYEAARNLFFGTMNDDNRWCASSDKPVTARLMCREVLSLKGITVCTITDCSQTLAFENSIEEDYAAFRSMEQIVLKLHPVVLASTSWKIYLEVLLSPKEADAGDAVRWLRPQPREGRMAYETMLRQEGCFWLERWAPDLYRQAGFHQSKIRRSKKLELAQSVMDVVNERNDNMRMFTTSTSHLGSGPEGLQVGDTVCILFGGRTPYIVRPHEEGEHHLLIGEAYVSGLMDGEAFSMGLPEREFLLR